MRSPPAQRGFLLIAAVVLIVVLGFFAVVISYIFVGSGTSSGEHLSSAKALLAAEAGFERAVYGYSTGTACAALVFAGTVGSGVFATTATFNNPASTTLSAAITNIATTIPLTSSIGYAASGRVRIEAEEIDYTEVAGNNLVGVRRGAAGTTAAAHVINTPVSQHQCLVESTGTADNARRVIRKAIISPQAMMVYAQANGNGNVFFRQWDGTAWGTPRNATAVSADIRFMVLKFARTRNEAVLGTLSSNGQIRVQVWNGATWSATTLLMTIAAGDSDKRGFDIEYETNTDRAIVVYNDTTADPDYRIWDGTAWSAVPTNINLTTTGDPLWIELASNPLSDEIAMIIADANDDVQGMRWTGGVTGAWSNMGAGVWDANAANSVTKVIDVAYEQQSGRAMFMWADITTTDQYYRIWDGTTLSAANILWDISTMGGDGEWIRLAPDPTSNRIMYGVQDAVRDLHTAFWNGAAWGSNTRHDTNMEDANDRNFDIAFDPGNAGNAWLIWGSRTGTQQANRKQWTGAAWGGTTTFGDDTALVQMAAQRYTGHIFAITYQDTSGTNLDILETHWLGAAWFLAPTIWGGPTVPNPVLERVAVAVERYIPTTAWYEVFP